MDKMILYHGTDLFSGFGILSFGIRLYVGQKYSDFGQGFYTTTNLDQAIKWARNTNAPCVLSMEFNEIGLSSKRFDTPNIEWATFVVENRIGIYSGEQYDYVMGPMADTGVATFYRDYKTGKLMLDDAARQIVGKTNGTQLVVLTEEAIKHVSNIKEVPLR